MAANPGSYPAHMALGEALAESSPDAALASFERAAALVPNAIGDDSPNARIAELALARGDKARAVRALETLTSLDPAALASARTLATLVDPAKEPARLRVALERAVAVDPFDAPSHATLGRLALAAGRTPEAVRMFRVALAAGAVDQAGAHADLAEALALAGQRDEAKRQALAALEDGAHLHARPGPVVEAHARQRLTCARCPACRVLRPSLLVLAWLAPVRGRPDRPW